MKRPSRPPASPRTADHRATIGRALCIAGLGLSLAACGGADAPPSAPPDTALPAPGPDEEAEPYVPCRGGLDLFGRIDDEGFEYHTDIVPSTWTSHSPFAEAIRVQTFGDDYPYSGLFFAYGQQGFTESSTTVKVVLQMPTDAPLAESVVCANGENWLSSEPDGFRAELSAIEVLGRCADLPPGTDELVYCAKYGNGPVACFDADGTIQDETLSGTLDGRPFAFVNTEAVRGAIGGLDDDWLVRFDDGRSVLRLIPDEEGGSKGLLLLGDPMGTSGVSAYCVGSADTALVRDRAEIQLRGIRKLGTCDGPKESTDHLSMCFVSPY